MPIKLITGIPGSGKSLSLIEECVKLKQQAADDDAPVRPVFIWGIDGVSEELGKPLRDEGAGPEDGWDASLIANWRDLPDGSIVVIDEVWKTWGQCMAGKEPDHVLALAEHRHRGFDFIIATQHPMQICTFARNMIGTHIHLRRKFGSHLVQRVEWGAVVTDLQSEGKRSLGSESVWKFPQDLFKYYKSASLHTVKRKLPWRVWALLGLVLGVPVILVAGWLVYKRLYSGFHPNAATPSHAAASSSGGGFLSGMPGTAGAAGSGSGDIQTAQQWMANQTPRVPGIPWSAPMWDHLKPNTTPDLYCLIAEGEGGTHTCRCYNEQDVPVRVHEEVCERAAHDGVYNPYRPAMDAGERSAGGRDAQAAPQPADSGRASDASAGLATGGAPSSGIPQSYTPPGYGASGQ